MATTSFVSASIASSCDSGTGTLTILEVVGGSGSYVYSVRELATGNLVVASTLFGPADLPIAIAGLADKTFEIVVGDAVDSSNADTQQPRIQCAGSGGGGGPTCDLILVSVTPTNPTTPGGFGFVTFTYTTATTGKVSSLVAGPGVFKPAVEPNTGQLQVVDLPAGNYLYTLLLVDNNSCRVDGEFTISDPAPAPDPSLNDPARWEPVGGVLPNPVPLAVAASLTDAAGLPRVGLHVELELWRPAATAAFVGFKATLRTASQLVDAAPYLRAQLVALPRYNVASAKPVIDPDAAMRFFYRYRAADAAGAEAWQQRAGERYAVLAALPGPTDTMAPYVADSTGAVASIFPSGEACQFVGLPLEVSVLLPPPTATPRWAELRYVDATGAAVEIRTYPLASTLPAGMLRIPLPADPPLCATDVEVSIRDDDRAFVGSCGYVVPPTPPPPGGTYADPIYGFY